MLGERLSRVSVQRWVRYRIDLEQTAPPPAGVSLTPLTGDTVGALRDHPDATQPDFASGLEFWNHGLRDAYLWSEQGQPLCMQWLLTNKDDEVLRGLPFWGSMYPRIEPDSGQVEKLWTFSTARAKGVATQFEYALFAQARARGLRRLFTHIGESNAPARRWADKTGWEAFGTIDRFTFDLPRIRNLDSSVCLHRTGPVSPVAEAKGR